MTKQKHTYFGFVRASALLAAVAFAAIALLSAGDARAASTEIVERQITIPNEELGPLTFDAIAAGDPAAIEQDRLVLLLHGFPQSRESFSEILPVLAAKGYYAVAPNLRGYSSGVRPIDRTQYTVEKSSVDAVAMAFVLGAEKFHVVGHDWGGAVAWGVSTAMPQVIKSNSVLSTPHPDAIKAAAKHWWSPQSLMLSYLLLVRIPDLEQAMFIAGPEGFALGLNVMGLPYAKARTYAKTIGNAAGLRAALSWYHANKIPLDYEIGKGGCADAVHVGRQRLRLQQGRGQFDGQLRRCAVSIRSASGDRALGSGEGDRPSDQRGGRAHRGQQLIIAARKA